MAKSNSAERYRLHDAFEAVRAALAAERATTRLQSTLSYWTLPADRRLPVALLDRTLGEIVESSFDRLAATPGIGLKKLDSLIVLLRRAYDASPPEGTEAVRESRKGDARDWEAASSLDPDSVSEADWAQWRATAQAHDLGRERLGRLAPSLLDLPTVIWATPLREYFPLSLLEIRHLKTHGEKRVRVVLEVFRSLHELLGNAGRHSRLAIRLVPRFVPPIEEWFCEVSTRPGPPDWHELRANLILPLINQLSYDAGPLVQKVAEGRLGVEGTCESVRMLSRRVNVTRSRVYQLLEMCQRVMAVRWPEGRVRFDALALRLDEPTADRETRLLYHAARELFFPIFPATDSIEGEASAAFDGETSSELESTEIENAEQHETLDRLDVHSELEVVSDDATRELAPHEQASDVGAIPPK